MGSIDNLNSSNTALNADESYTGQFSALTNYSEICISIETDKIYTLILNFSSNGSDVGYTTTYANKSPSVGIADLFFSPPNMRYLQVILENTDATDQSYLRLQTLLKSNITYQFSSGPSANVDIKSPLDGSGFVEVSVQNAVDISGTVDISGQTVLVDISCQTVDISGQFILVDISGQTVDISGQTVHVGNFPSTYQIVDVNTNSVKVVPVGTTTGYTNNSLQVIDTNSKYDDSGNLYVNVNNTPTVEILSNNYAAGALLVCSDIVQTVGGKLWNNVLVNQNETSDINNATFQSSSNLTIFGKADGSCTIGVQFSDSPVNEFFTSQYQISVIGAGSFGACIAGFCAPTVRLILLSADSRTITAFTYFS